MTQLIIKASSICSVFWFISGWKSKISSEKFLNTFSWCSKLSFFSFFFFVKEISFSFVYSFRFRFQTHSVVENLVQRRCHSSASASNCFVYSGSPGQSSRAGCLFRIAAGPLFRSLEAFWSSWSVQAKTKAEAARQLQSSFFSVFFVCCWISCFVFCVFGVFLVLSFFSVSAFHSSWSCSGSFLLFLASKLLHGPRFWSGQVGT